MLLACVLCLPSISFYKVLAAKDFGVPQNRERIYLVCFDKHTVKNWEAFSYPVPPCTKTSLASVLEDNVDEKYTLSDKLWEGHQSRKVENKKAGKVFPRNLLFRFQILRRTGNLGIR